MLKNIFIFVTKCLLIGFGELEVFVESCVGVVKGDDKAFGAEKSGYRHFPI
jgi:hypothetical protein